MELDRKQILHLAGLARLNLTSEEVERYARQLGEVLSYVNKLQELKPQSEVEQLKAADLRSDTVQLWPQANELIREAPAHTETHIEVPAVFEDRAA